MAAWAFLIVGWLLIWRDYPIFGALCIALFAVLQWAKYAAKGVQNPRGGRRVAQDRLAFAAD